MVLIAHRLLTTGEFSDVTLICGPDAYKVHKNIVCSRAEFFARAIKFGGKVCLWSPFQASRCPLVIGQLSLNETTGS